MIVSPALIDGSSENIRRIGPEGITFSRAQPADILSPLASTAASWDRLQSSHLLPSQGWRMKEERRGSSIFLGLEHPARLGHFWSASGH